MASNLAVVPVSSSSLDLQSRPFLQTTLPWTRTEHQGLAPLPKDLPFSTTSPRRPGHQVGHFVPRVRFRSLARLTRVSVLL